MSAEKYKNYIQDLICLLNEKARDAQNSSGCDQFELGRSMAFYEVFSLIKDQAQAFEIELSQIGLDNINIESFLKKHST